ncbi:uncharacterized protein BP5553_09064 [Venustampulla echinocandica]|uniref:Uncharacterized protein n=1 Tax=Venustampulla echinocandica TaxID=2656787 RepID=A0A370TDR7_9HELO|nr:uncharacterized protein BP5553_09064 [Venustampulla echinocandica]RDL32608.1 hypothetical protein BP5553_09064 [Venustampulla echinocandica]
MGLPEEESFNENIPFVVEMPPEPPAARLPVPLPSPSPSRSQSRPTYGSTWVGTLLDVPQDSPIQSALNYISKVMLMAVLIVAVAMVTIVSICTSVSSTGWAEHLGPLLFPPLFAGSIQQPKSLPVPLATMVEQLQPFNGIRFLPPKRI